MPLDAAEGLPDWARGERSLASMLPYVSLVDDRTVRTRGDEFLRCLRVDGIGSHTTPDEVIERTRRLVASAVAQAGTDFSFWVHKVSRAADVATREIAGDGFAAAMDRRWRDHLDRTGLRDRTLTLTIAQRPAGGAVPLRARASAARLRDRTAKRLQRLDETARFFASILGGMRPHALSAAEGSLLGFLGSLNTGRAVPILPGPRHGFLSASVANARITFAGAGFTIKDAGRRRHGTTFAVKAYPGHTEPTMLDELDLPIDMVVSHSFTPANANLMASRIRRQQRLMRASDDGAVSLLEELGEALDDLEAKRLSFGDHHMTVTLIADQLEVLDDAAAELRNATASSGLVLVSEAMAARAHFFAQHPGNGAFRARKAAVTNVNFADMAALHRTATGKAGADAPWGTPIAVLPTPERGAFRLSYHEAGAPDREPTAGHTLILGRPGSGKSVLSAFLMTSAKRAEARTIVFDYRRGMEMAVHALGGRYETVEAGRPTGLNPLRTEVDASGEAWLADWLALLIAREDRPLTPSQANLIRSAVRQNAEAQEGLRNWTDLASLFASADDEGDLFERIRAWTDDGRHGWVFGTSREDTLSLSGDTVGFDLTGLLDAESDRERMAVLAYLFRRVERLIEDRRPTVIVVDEAWKALDTAYFAERLTNWLVTARKQNAVVVMMTQYASQLERTRTGRTIVEAVPTQILLPNVRAKASDYELLDLNEKELGILLEAGQGARLALVRDDRGSTVVDADLSALGPYLTILGGMEAGERLVGEGWRDRPDFWRAR